MSIVNNIIRNTINKVFINFAKEAGIDVSQVQLGIYYENGQHKYEGYNNFKKVKDIDINDYSGSVIDFSGGTEIINMTIAQSGTKYAKELNCETNDINIIMSYKKDGFPFTVLLCKGKKVRNIQFEQELSITNL